MVAFIPKLGVVFRAFGPQGAGSEVHTQKFAQKADQVGLRSFFRPSANSSTEAEPVAEVGTGGWAVG